MNDLISNWDDLTEDQKQDVLKHMDNSPNFEKIEEPNPGTLFFQTTGWAKIENFISAEMASLFYHHAKLSVERLLYIENKFPEKNNEDYYGSFGDGQSTDYSRYGDPIFDALVDTSLGKVQEITNVPLISNYSYYRLYTTGSILEKHTDRASCEYSVTVCLGYDVSNVDQNTYPNYDWPMFVNDRGMSLPVHMKPGDAIIYKGCEIEHWREPFWGLNHAQLFLHYSQADGQFNIKNDGREIMGLPGEFRSSNSISLNSEPVKK
jgi:hypothetical protein